MAERKAGYRGNIRIETLPPTGVPFTYSDFVAVQTTTYAIQISFFQMELPFWETEADRKKFEENPTVPATCVARVALPREQAQRLYNALREHFGAVGKQGKGE